MTKLGIFISFMIIAAVVFGQGYDGDPTAQFTKKQYKKDLQQLVRLIKKNHPQRTTFISKKEFNQLKKDKLKTITDSTSLGQFLWLCEDISASIQCGHTFVWWPKDFGFIPDTLLFPVDTWTDGVKLYISDARNNTHKTSSGSEILFINGVSAETLLKAMYDSSPSDGNIESFKRNWIKGIFNSMCPMYFNYPEYYTLQVKSNEGLKTLQLDKYQWQERLSANSDGCSDQLCLSIDSTEFIATLTVKSFDYYENDFEVFKHFIDSSFLAINERGIEHLIIDLRGNGGGDSKCGSYLIEHIANKPYCYWPTDPKATWQKDLFATIQPNSGGYKGVPFILVDGGCFSTSGHVCSIIKENKIGILVGEETGSTYTCNDSSLNDSLKNTALTCRIPRTTFYTCATSFPKNRGIIPDVQIVRTIDDIINQLDPEMKYVLDQIGLK